MIFRKFLILIIMSVSVTPWSVCDHPTKLSSENTLLAPAPANKICARSLTALSCVRPKIGSGRVAQDLCNAAATSALTAQSTDKSYGQAMGYGLSSV